MPENVEASALKHKTKRKPFVVSPDSNEAAYLKGPQSLAQWAAEGIQNLRGNMAFVVEDQKNPYSKRNLLQRFIKGDRSSSAESFIKEQREREKVFMAALSRAASGDRGPLEDLAAKDIKYLRGAEDLLARTEVPAPGARERSRARRLEIKRLLMLLENSNPKKAAELVKGHTRTWWSSRKTEEGWYNVLKPDSEQTEDAKMWLEKVQNPDPVDAADIEKYSDVLKWLERRKSVLNTHIMRAESAPSEHPDGALNRLIDRLPIPTAAKKRKELLEVRINQRDRIQDAIERLQRGETAPAASIVNFVLESSLHRGLRRDNLIFTPDAESHATVAEPLDPLELLDLLFKVDPAAGEQRADRVMELSFENLPTIPGVKRLKYPKS